MKRIKLLSIIIGFLVSIPAFANQVLLSERLVTLPVDISQNKVVRSNKGYGTVTLVKILVPTLADVTVLNHRNEGESAPYMATWDTDDTQDVIGQNPGLENIPFKIQLLKDTALVQSEKGQVCAVTLTEYVTATIHGYEFKHIRQQPVADRDPADCR